MEGFIGTGPRVDWGGHMAPRLLSRSSAAPQREMVDLPQPRLSVLSPPPSRPFPPLRCPHEDRPARERGRHTMAARWRGQGAAR